MAALAGGTTTIVDFAIPASGRMGAMRCASDSTSRPPLAATTRLRIGAPVYFVHQSTPAAIDLVAASRQHGVRACSESCPHYLTLRAGHGWASFVAVEPRYNLLFRQPERELLPMCAEQRIAVLPYNPLSGGLLTGEHDPRSGPAPDSRFASGPAVSLYRQLTELDAVEVLANIAAEAGLPLPRVAVAWVMANPVVTAPILGATQPGQLDATAAAASTFLDADILAAVDRATACSAAVMPSSEGAAGLHRSET